MAAYENFYFNEEGTTSLVDAVLRVDLKNQKFYVDGEETSDVERIGFAMKRWAASAKPVAV